MAWTDPRTWVTGELVTAALLNTHLRDNLKAIGDPWTAYTPTCSWTVGNGTLTGRYRQVGKAVDLSIRLALGSTSTASSIVTFTLPVPLRGTPGTGEPFGVGSAWLWDNNLADNYYAVPVKTGSADTIRLNIPNGTATAASVTDVVPFTWINGDIIRVNLSYEAA